MINVVNTSAAPWGIRTSPTSVISQARTFTSTSAAYFRSRALTSSGSGNGFDGLRFRPSRTVPARPLFGAPYSLRVGGSLHAS